MSTARSEKSKSRGILWACGLATGIIGSGAFTAIVIFGFVQYREFWPFIPIAVVIWAGLALAWKWLLIAGIVQIVVSVTLPLIFHSVALAIDPAGHLGAALGVIIIVFLCSLPLLISGVFLLLSWKKERKHLSQLKDEHSG